MQLAQRAGPAKWAAYNSHLKVHSLPRYGNVPLSKITRQSVKLFVKHLKTSLDVARADLVLPCCSHGKGNMRAARY
jgi:hypothetical protein